MIWTTSWLDFLYSFLLASLRYFFSHFLLFLLLVETTLNTWTFFSLPCPGSVIKFTHCSSNYLCRESWGVLMIISTLIYWNVNKIDFRNLEHYVIYLPSITFFMLSEFLNNLSFAQYYLNNKKWIILIYSNAFHLTITSDEYSTCLSLLSYSCYILNFYII